MTRGFLALLLALILLTGAVPVAAQTDVMPAQTETAAGTATETGAIDFEAWEAEADRIETLLEAGTASTSFFQNLRATLVDWRARLLAAQDANASRIATLEAQIAALGPAPEDGNPEPDAIAERRAELDTRLADARVPQVNAAAAFTRADGLIQEVDALLRERQQQQLLQLDPSPLNPVNWAMAATALRDLAVSIQRQISSRIADPVRRDELVDSAPVIVLLALLGLLALFRGRLWTERLTERLQSRALRARPHGSGLSGLASPDHGAHGRGDDVPDGGGRLRHDRAAGDGDPRIRRRPRGRGLCLALAGRAAFFATMPTTSSPI